MQVIHVIPQSRMDRQQLSDYLKEHSYEKGSVNMEVYSGERIEFTINDNIRIWVWNLDK